MATSRVKTNLFLTFEIATKWQYVCYTQRSYKLISLNQPKTVLCVIFHDEILMCVNSYLLLP